MDCKVVGAPRPELVAIPVDRRARGAARGRARRGARGGGARARRRPHYTSRTLQQRLITSAGPVLAESVSG
jgi:hypothetical protein